MPPSARNGPFGRAGAGGKGDDDRDDDDLDGDDDGRDDGRGDEDDPAIERSLVAFERLFELLLKPGAETRQAVAAFDLAQYICERLQPDAAQAFRWLEKLIPGLLKAGVPQDRRDDVAAAIMTALNMSPTPVRFRWARACLLRLELDLSGNPPSAYGLSGFQSVLPQTKTFLELWPQLQAIRTYGEQVRAYVAALTNGGSSDGFRELEQAAAEKCPALKAGLASKEPFKRIIVLDAFSDSCPRCYIVLPTGEQGKLRSVGVATAKNCCQRILVWPGA